MTTANHPAQEPGGKAPRGRILVVDDEEDVLLTTSAILEDLGYHVERAPSGKIAIEKIAGTPYDLVLTDLAMKEHDGLAVLRAVRDRQTETVAIMMTGYASLDSAVEAVRLGAYDYLTKPTNIDDLVSTIERGLEKRRLTLELRRRVEELATLNRLVNAGVDAVLRSIKDPDHALARIAEIVTDLLAPTGAALFVTGPELARRASHVRGKDAGSLVDDASALSFARQAVTSLAPQFVERPRAILAVPVEWQGKTQGALVVLEPEPRAWTSENIQTALTIAHRAALALENAALFRQTMREKEMLSLILNAAGDGIVGLDAEGRVLFFNRACERLTGCREGEVRGRPLDGFTIDHSTTESLAAIRARCSRSENRLTTGEILFRAASGVEVFCDVVCSELPPSQAAPDGVNVVLALRDARERRRLEEQRTSALSHVTHELKTPLTSILAYTYLLGSGKLGALTDRQTEAAAVMRRNGKHLLELIENMLATAQLDQGLTRYRFRALKLAEIASQTREVFGAIATERGLDLSVEVDGDPELTADHDMITMALNNLVGNALRFTEKGGRVRVVLADRGGEIAIEVHDSGIGIPPELHERVFQRYFQVDHARGGSGLGLWIVRTIVAAHGGRIRLESRPFEGAHFFIALPKVRTEAVPTA